jgi:hypothetical protein
MNPEDILKKCAEFNVKLYVKDNKLTPAGSLPIEFIKISAEFVPYKQQIIDYIKQNNPELVIESKAPQAAPAVRNTPNDRIQRLRIPCVNLGPAIEKPAGCGCNGNVVHKCNLFGKCRRAGNSTDMPVCVDCDKYEPSA